MKHSKRPLLLGLASLAVAAAFGSAAPRASAQVVNNQPCRTQVWAMFTENPLGFWECVPRYDWNLMKKVEPTCIVVPPAGDPTVTYTLKACRQTAPPIYRIGVRGRVHLLNETACPTQGLNIVFIVTYTDSTGVARQIVTPPQIVKDLPPNQNGDGTGIDSEIIPFEVIVAQGPNVARGTNYVVTAVARTANQLLPFANLDPVDGFSVPPFSTTIAPIDACATVVDPVASLPGFTVKSNAPVAWNLSDANLDSNGCATMCFKEDFQNCGVPCGQTLFVPNCAVLIKCNSITDVRTATATLTISTGPCPCDKDKDKGKDGDKDKGKGGK